MSDDNQNDLPATPSPEGEPNSNGSNIRRSVSIQRDAHQNVIITGDGNRVVISENRRTAGAEIQVSPETDISAELGPNPYKGLAAFQEADADRFFGRERVTERLFQRLRELRETPGTTRLLGVLGPSGCGKSSVARAGLIPEIARKGFRGMDEVRVAVLTPGNHPVEALALALARLAINSPIPIANGEDYQETFEGKVAKNHHGIRKIADTLPGIDTKPLVLLVDQFEEVFTLEENQESGDSTGREAAERSAEEERDVFIGNLIQAAKEPGGRVSVVLTLRSDFLGQAARYPELSGLISAQNEIVPAMGRADLEAAIGKPAENAGRPLEPAVVDLLASETLGRDDALPLLEFALQRLWRGMAEEKRDPAEVLREIGGVGGALAGEAERLFQKLDEPRRKIAQRVFLRLVRLGEGAATGTRRRVLVDDLIGHRDDPTMVWDVLIRLSCPELRLISLSDAGDWRRRAVYPREENAGEKRANVFENNSKKSLKDKEWIQIEYGRMAEITHEAIFANWDRMKKWIRKKEKYVDFEKELNIQVGAWFQNGKPENLLWFHRKKFKGLLFFLDNNPSGLTHSQFEFFRASKAAKNFQKIKVFGIFALAMLLFFVTSFGRRTLNYNRGLKNFLQAKIPPQYQNIFFGEEFEIDHVYKIIEKMGFVIDLGMPFSQSGISEREVKGLKEAYDEMVCLMDNKVFLEEETKIDFLVSIVVLGSPYLKDVLSSDQFFLENLDRSNEIIESLSYKWARQIFQKIYENNAKFLIENFGPGISKKKNRINKEFKLMSLSPINDKESLGDKPFDFFIKEIELKFGKKYVFPSISIRVRARMEKRTLPRHSN
jgi:hypothetical protein